MSSGVAIALIILAGGSSAAPAGPTVTVSGTSLQIDGRPTFLVGVSLFDALGPVAPSDGDLDALRGWGVKLVRVWAHWHEPIYQADGALTAQGRGRLLQLVQRLQARGMILELVLLRPGQLPGGPFAVFASEAARLRAVESMTSALGDYRNVLFDLYNEHDHPDGPISHRAARQLRDKVKAIDAARVVTISSTEMHLVGPDGRADDERRRNLREEAGTDANAVNVDVLAPHFPRTDDWAASTGSRIGAIRMGLDAVGRMIPIYLSEERRAEARAVLAPDVYQRAAVQAREAGAAGWVFHTAAGFELGKRSFIDALGKEERAALSQIVR